MHATIQKPIEEIVSYIKPGEKVFIVGCANCAAKCHSGGEAEVLDGAVVFFDGQERGCFDGVHIRRHEPGGRASLPFPQ